MCRPEAAYVQEMHLTAGGPASRFTARRQHADARKDNSANLHPHKKAPRTMRGALLASSTVRKTRYENMPVR